MTGDDLTPFFVEGEFVHADDELDGIAVSGLFCDAYARTGGGFGMSDSRPAYVMALNAMPLDPLGLVLRHKGANFNVLDFEPDGTGMVVLILEVSA